MQQSPALLLDLYELTMAESYLEFKPGTLATFDLFVRELPLNRGFLIACGLEDALHYIENLKFDIASIDYLKKQDIFSEKFLHYLRNFKFKGDVWALPEGTVCFPNEPLIRVTAGIIEAQVIESFLLNAVNLQTMLVSKAARVVLAALDRSVYDFALRRAHGRDAAVKAARAAYIAGCKGTSCVMAGSLYGIPIAGTMAHSYVMSFKTELAAFRAYAKVFPQNTILLVDTYDTESGIDNAIIVGNELEAKGYKLKGIRLDSGNIAALSKLARARLDRAGFGYVKIFASGNLDEYKIEKLLKQGVRADSFGVGTNMGVSNDAPYLDGIYKISEVADINSEFMPTMKLSKGKVTYPGRKQVFRVKDKHGNYVKDILGLENEKINAEPLLVKAVEQGKVIYKQPPLEEIRKNAQKNLTHLPKKYKEMYPRAKYPVEISPLLLQLTRRLSRELR